MTAPQDPATRRLRWIGLLSFFCWAMFVAAALRFEGVARSPENHLRLAVAVIGAAVALFTVARAGGWPRLLYLLTVGYLAYFAAGSAWHELWHVAAAAPTEGVAETLAVTFELAYRIVAGQLDAGREALALAQAFDLVFMPVVQLVIVLYLARVLIGNR
ncbi:MAG TPA: hypothetical protein VN675_13530 [Burkholderiales bacterium]|nr:hypothetical protein [Burkholderiales bacterium]